jgi:hypothetical protein
MTKLFLTTAALATILASSPLAAPSKHRVPMAHDGMGAYGIVANGQYYARDPDVVIDGNRVVGRDPDIGIRSQLLKDDHVSDY